MRSFAMMSDMNRDLILPPHNDPEGIFAFAMTFNGYEAHGSFDACARAAKAKRRASLEDLRNELFFACRASRHCGDDGFVEVYAELRPHFERMLADGI